MAILNPRPSLAGQFKNNTIMRLFYPTPSITLNGTTVAPNFIYFGGDASAAGWPGATINGTTYGATLAYQAGTAPSYNVGSPFHQNSVDDGLKFNEGGFFRDGGTSTGHITTEDFIWLLVFRPLVHGVASKFHFAKIEPGYTNGYYSYITSDATSGRMALRGAADATPAFTLLPNGACIVLFGANRDEASANGSVTVVNNTENAGVDLSALSAGLCASGTSLTLGANQLGSACISHYFCFAMWKRDNWLASGAGGKNEVVALAQQYFTKACSIYPNIAWGTATPSSLSRTTITNEVKETAGVKKYYTVGDALLAVNKRTISSRTIYGLQKERQVTNICLESDTIDSATWTKVAGTISTDSANGPDGTATLDGIVGDANDTQHGVTQAINLTAVVYCISVWAKKGNKDWLYLSDETVANGYGYFNLSTGAVGLLGGGVSGDTGANGIESWGNDLYRCWITVLGTVAAHTIAVYSAHASGDNDFAGDAATVNTHIGCVMVHTGSYPMSYTKTLAGAVAKAVSTCQFSSTNNVVEDQGSIWVRFYSPSFTMAAPQTRHSLIAISDNGGAGAELVNIYTDSDRTAKVATAHAGGDAGAVTSGTDVICDGGIHEILTSWRHNELRLWLDGKEYTPDTSVDSPSGLSTVWIGSDYASNTSAFPMEIIDYKIFPRFLSSFYKLGQGFR